jgi:predicted DNA-binding protein with PD1-like motif
MKSKLLHEADGQRTYALILSEGDEAMACLKSFAAAERISATQITAIGALSSGEISFFDWERKEYLPIKIDEQVEVASLTGDIALDVDGAPAVHAHVVLGRRDGSARAGHFVRGLVRPTLEVIVTESPAHLRKKLDRTSGLALIDP